MHVFAGGGREGMHVFAGWLRAHKRWTCLRARGSHHGSSCRNRGGRGGGRDGGDGGLVVYDLGREGHRHGRLEPGGREGAQLGQRVLGGHQRQGRDGGERRSGKCGVDVVWHLLRVGPAWLALVAGGRERHVDAGVGPLGLLALEPPEELLGMGADLDGGLRLHVLCDRVAKVSGILPPGDPQPSKAGGRQEVASSLCISGQLRPYSLMPSRNFWCSSSVHFSRVLVIV